MSERTAWATLARITPLITAITWDEPAWMYLEPAPQTYRDPAVARDELRFARLDSATTFERWERGRVFNAEQELRWEKVGQAFHVVYCGDAPPNELTEIAHTAGDPQKTSYYLWGQQVQEVKAIRDDLDLQMDESAFIELRIPRILRYPASVKTRYVQVRVRELIGADGSLYYARWAGIIEEAR